MTGVDRLVEADARWYLAHHGAGGLERRIAGARGAVRAARRRAAGDRPSEWRAPRAEPRDGSSRRASPSEVAWAHALTPELMQAPDIIAVAERTGRPVEEVTRALPRAGRAARHRLAARRARRAARNRRARSAGRCRPCARTASTRSRELARGALDDGGARQRRAGRPSSAYLEGAPALTRRLAAVTAALSVEGTGDLPALMLAVRALRATGRLMAELDPGPAPALRRRREATCGSRPTAPCEVEVARRTRADVPRRRATTTRSCTARARAGPRRRTRSARRRAVVAASRLAVSAERVRTHGGERAVRIALGSCRVAAPHGRRTRCARTSIREGREVDALRVLADDMCRARPRSGRTRSCCSATRSTPTRSRPR
jgi:hypothetical protein